MNGLLNGNVRLWHLLVIGVLFGVISGSTVALAGPTPRALWPNGTIRLASAQNPDTISIVGSNNPPVRVLRATITVPSGKHADLHTLTCGCDVSFWRRFRAVVRRALEAS